MPLLPPFTATRVSARLLVAETPVSFQAARRHRFPLIVVGPAFLLRQPTGGWSVPVVGGGSLLPTTTRLRAAEVARQPAVRIAAALLDPADLGGGWPALRSTPRGSRVIAPCPEFYGWSLLYQLPGDDDVARVDSHEEWDDLPAFYESPLEITDRQEHLARRGVPSRVLALLTSRFDFETACDEPPRNRYCRHARWRHVGAAVAFGG